MIATGQLAAENPDIATVGGIFPVLPKQTPELGLAALADFCNNIGPRLPCLTNGEFDPTRTFSGMFALPNSGAPTESIKASARGALRQHEFVKRHATRADNTYVQLRFYREQRRNP